MYLYVNHFNDSSNSYVIWIAFGYGRCRGGCFIRLLVSKSQFYLSMTIKRTYAYYYFLDVVTFNVVTANSML